MSRLKISLLAILFALSAAACGLKGPLYLPGDMQAPAPASAEGGDEATPANEDEPDEKDS